VSTHVGFDPVDANHGHACRYREKNEKKDKKKYKAVNPNSLPGKISKHNCPLLSG
jgi:hypothetical protein